MNEFVFGKNRLPLGKKTYIMGILNVTPDSFSDGGNYNEVKKAVVHTQKMINDGADIIDIGAVSTRPYSEPVSAAEEWERIRDILYEIRRNYSVPLSIDTFNPYTAERCLDMGADIINDVSGIFSSDMAEIIKKYNCGWVIMHGGVALRKAEEEVQFENGIISDVNCYFDGMLEKAAQKGIPAENICLDAGFGFSKNSEQNTELLKNYDKLNKHGLSLLCALSRKRFIGELMGETDSENRDSGTLAANISACMKGADIIRVHNVSLHKKSLQVIDRLFRI